MTDLGRPDTFQDAEGTIDVVAIPGHAPGTSSWELDYYETTGPLLFRPRFVSIFGNVSAGAGTVTFAFQGLTSGLLGDPWPAGGPLVCPSPVAIASGARFSIAWNTEIADNYSGPTSSFGTAVVAGMPVVYLPRLTTFSILATASAGATVVPVLEGGMMQLERLSPATASAGGDEFALYLQPTGA